jgi:hypothetical protein
VNGLIRDYIHAELGKEVNALSGYYVAVDEKKVPYNGREALCFIGEYVTQAIAAAGANRAMRRWLAIS